MTILNNKKGEFPFFILLSFSLGFLSSVIFGTLIHEFAHWIFAEFLGYKTTIHYNAISFDDISLNEPHTIDKVHDIIITGSGIICTILIGTTAFLYLLKTKLKDGIMFWMLIYLSLFWSREVINLIISVVLYFFRISEHPFGGDEYYLEGLLGIQDGFLCVSLGIIGLVVCMKVVLEVLPQKFRYMFLFSGLTFGLLSYYFWFYVIGPILLP